MKDEFITIGGSPAVLTFPDFQCQEIIVNGRIWRFDFDRFTGPFWLRKDGEGRRCQNPNKKVWAAFDEWHKNNVKTSGKRPILDLK